MDASDSESVKHVEKPGKSLEWSALPVVDNSSSEGTDSDYSSCQLVLHSGGKVVTGHSPQGTDLTSEQMQESTRSGSGHMEGGVGCTSLLPFSNFSLPPKVLLRSFSPQDSAASAQDLNPAALSFPIIQTPGLASWGTSPLDSLLCSPSPKGLLFPDLHKSRSPSDSKTVLEPFADLHLQYARPQLK